MAVAVVVTVAKGYDLGYVWKNQGQKEHEPRKSIGGYYINAAQAGEPPGRWWGPGAKALGLTTGQVVEREPHNAARLAGGEQALAYWTGREQRFQEILHSANRAALDYLQTWAGVTRTGYHGVRVDGHEPGRYEAAGLIVSSWLKGTSRDGDP